MDTRNLRPALPLLVLFLVLPLALLASPAAWTQEADAPEDSQPAFRTGPSGSADGGGSAGEASPSSLTAAKALVLGAVEGITEYLPVSSTGHLLVAGRLLGLWRSAEEKAAADAYAVCIQLGAILAVFVISFPWIRRMARGLFGRDPGGLRLLGRLVLAVVPAALVGLLFEDRLKQYLFNVPAVTAAWVAGGLFILLALRKPGSAGGRALEDLGWDTALWIGLAQILALWPGVSRSLATLGAGILLGLSVPAAVEFSFLLGLVTLGGATIYEGVTKGREIVALFGWVNPLLGLAAAAATAFLAVRWMVGYLKQKSPVVFGWYRIGVGAAAAVLFAARLL
jgi:undecaprenyl-diphosphatase